MMKQPKGRPITGVVCLFFLSFLSDVFVFLFRSRRPCVLCEVDLISLVS